MSARRVLTAPELVASVDEGLVAALGYAVNTLGGRGVSLKVVDDRLRIGGVHFIYVRVGLCAVAVS